jgi:hypothetical protein
MLRRSKQPRFRRQNHESFIVLPEMKSSIAIADFTLKGPLEEDQPC